VKVMPDLRIAGAIGAAAATFAVGAVVASGLSAGNGDPALGRSPAERSTRASSLADSANDWQVQAIVASYESRLLRYAEQDGGFAGARFAFRTRSFILYGAGPPPPVVRRLLADAPFGVHATWVEVPYSRAELGAAMRALRRAMPARSVVEHAPNFSGVLVGLRPLPASRGRQAALYARAQQITDVPVTFLQTGPADPM
jgi:hypothetical protein